MAPRETHDICQLFFDGRVKEAAQLQIDFIDLINALFCEVNPIPVKVAMRMKGYNAGPLRLPLTELEPEHEALLRRCLEAHNLL